MKSILYQNLTADHLGYMKIEKWKDTFQELVVLRRRLAGIYALILLAVIFVLPFNYISLYQCFLKLNQENKGAKQFQPSMQEYLEEFLFQGKRISEEQFCGQFSSYSGETVNAKAPFSAMILQVEGYYEHIENFGQKDAFGLKCELCSLLTELSQKYLYVFSLVNHDNTIVFVIQSKPTDTEHMTVVEERIFREFKKGPAKDYRICLIGTKQKVSYEKLPKLVEKLLKVGRESFFYPPDSFLIYEEVYEEHHAGVRFDKLDMKKIMNLLHIEKDNGAHQYREISKLLENCSSNDYMSVMIWFGISLIRNRKEVLYAEEGQQRQYNNFMECLTKCEKKEQVDALFESLFTRLQDLQEQGGQKKKILQKIEEVRSYITENYSNVNISLDYLGDRFNLSANYLGRAFKKETGVSVSEYLNDIRIQKTIELLESTDKSVKEIAELCGFTSINYFYTYFKKKIGLTPQLYREKVHQAGKQ